MSNAAGDPAPEAAAGDQGGRDPPTIAIDAIVGSDVVNVKAASAGFAIP